MKHCPFCGARLPVLDLSASEKAIYDAVITAGSISTDKLLKAMGSYSVESLRSIIWRINTKLEPKGLQLRATKGRRINTYSLRAMPNA